MALKFDKAQRNIIAEKLIDLGNLILLALTLGQVIANRYEIKGAALGVIIFVICYSIAFKTMNRR